jgi:O-antigen/teichoic acid export membrane protein
MGSTSKLSKNIVYNLVGQGLALVFGFVAVRYVFKQLGEDALGIIYFTATMSAVLCTVLELGMCSTIVREVSTRLDDEPAYVRKLIRTASLICWSSYALLAAAVYRAAPFLVEKWIHSKTMDAATATRMVQVLGMAALVAMPRSFYVSLLRGLQRMEFINLIDVSTSALQQLGIIVILSFGGGLFAAVDWLALCFVLGLLAYMLVCAQFFSFRALLPGFFPAAARRNFGFAASMMAISLLSMVHMQADKLIVSKLLPIGVFGFYAVASGAVSRANLLSGAIAQAAFPVFSTLSQARDQTSFLAQYRPLQDLVCLATVPAYAAIVFAAGPLFTYLLNAEAARLLLLPVAFLCLGFYMNGTLQVPYVASLAVGKPQITARLNFYALFVILPSTTLLVFRFGIAGAGFSWVAYHLFAYAYAVPLICAECLGTSLAGWYAHVLRVAVLAAGTYGVAWAIVVSLDAQNLMALAMAYVGASLVYLGGAYALVGSELREACLRSLAAARLRIAEVR